MPYFVHFSKRIAISDPEQYINDCCIGGDVVLAQLLPALQKRYENVQSDQEDWGWFAWLSDARIKLAVDVHTHDPKSGTFEVHLTSRRPRLLLGDKVVDTPELETLRELIVSLLQAWGVAELRIERAAGE